MSNLNIPIVMLHHIGNRPHSTLKGWTISNQKFIELLNSISEKGLRTITFEDIHTQSFSEKELKNKIILTFDDCPVSLFEFAVPELIRRKMKAVFYIPTAYIAGYNEWDVKSQGFERTALINEEQIRFLAANGMEIGSHGDSHIQLNKINAEQAIHELKNSKHKLEELTGKEVVSFAYPYAEVPDNYKVLLNIAGYSYGVCLYNPSPDNFALRRFGIHQSDSKKSIRYKVGRKYLFLRSFIDPLLFIIKKIKV